MYSKIKVLGLTSVYKPTVKSVNNTGKTERGAASFILAPARVSVTNTVRKLRRGLRGCERLVGPLCQRWSQISLEFLRN